MGIMVCGAETTREDEFIYSEDVQKRIALDLERLALAYSQASNPYERLSRQRAILENLVWFAVCKSEE